ncbi:uncharacterized protein KRP23_5737 [Phytophthora ramorum]|uniref:uncharacterized protein n=1 Tax=Phytophthora ramorum TaxID=164328 RepID=UPI0030ACA45A|nr:hypothetical protein KRP23_5737 [Phytophthora ramorum]
MHHQLKILQKSYDTAVYEKHELEAHLQAAKDTAVSLSDQVEILHERSKGDDKQVLALEQRLRLCEERNVSLEKELGGARGAIERERHAWEEALCDEEEKRESDSIKYRSLAQDNQVLQVQAIELKRELEAEQAKLVEAEKVNEDLRAASEDASTSHHEEFTASVEKRKELEQEIAQLRSHLKEQEMEIEDTANRLQEYEKRIASTCEAMNDHEQAHERENERIRNECANIEAKWKEEQVKNVELSRLLQEKNQLILNMTHRVNHGECAVHNNQIDVQFEHSNCNASRGNQDPHAGGEQRMVAHSCSRHPATDQPSKASLSHPSAVVKVEKRPLRRSSHTVPVRPTGRYTRPDELESPKDANSIAEEVLIDKHTSKVHEDIRLLQERISKRLEQVPAYAQLPPQLLQRARRPLYRREPKSPISLCSSLSDSDSSEESQSISDRVRRARLRRIQAQKQAMVLAVSPALSHLASRAQSSTLKARERENVALSANTSKKKSGRKTNSSRVTVDRSTPSKVSEKKKGTRKHVAIAGHAGRVL